MFSEIVAKDLMGTGDGTDNMTAILVYFTENIKANPNFKTINDQLYQESKLDDQTKKEVQ